MKKENCAYCIKDIDVTNDDYLVIQDKDWCGLYFCNKKCYNDFFKEKPSLGSRIKRKIKKLFNK